MGFDKLVISSTLERASSGNTRLVREFQSEEIRQLKAKSAKDITVSGPTLAAQFIKAGLIDEIDQGRPGRKPAQAQADPGFSAAPADMQRS
jgi:hypothetical protein